jgi:ABC-type multidrug transport system fused ATPase/permease subunit
LSLKVKPGEILGLVGPSRSGKSTIARLLLLIYDPIVGEVLVHGKPLDRLKRSWSRDQVGYVAKEPILFPGTIRYNITVGKPDAQATDDEVFAAAKAACAHEFIPEMPEGYETEYNKGAGLHLSGG